MESEMKSVAIDVVYEARATDFIDFARNLIESIRESADLDYRTSQACVELVVSQLYKEYSLAPLAPLSKILSEDLLDVKLCNDSVRMRQCLTNLSAFKADAQQRSWSLYEDADSILENLNNLQDLMKKADPRVSNYILAEEDYIRLHDLVEFYQMETRLFLRIAFLDAFKLVLQFRPLHASILLTTVLPIEIATDMLNDRVRNERKFQLSLEVLACLFSTAEQVPFSFYDVLNENFVAALLDLVESENQSGSIVEAATTCLIAFSLHFRTVDDNLLVHTLRQRPQNAKKLTETLLLLVNKRVDPVWLYKNEECPYVSSVLKLLEILFTDERTSKLFYANDASVLMDIVLRELRDLLPGKMRTEYLSLLSILVTKSVCFDEDGDHRSDDILQLVSGLERNAAEDGSSERDKEYFAEIVRSLIKRSYCTPE